MHYLKISLHVFKACEFLILLTDFFTQKLSIHLCTLKVLFSGLIVPSWLYWSFYFYHNFFVEHHFDFLRISIFKILFSIKKKLSKCSGNEIKFQSLFYIHLLLFKFLKQYVPITEFQTLKRCKI